MSTATIAWMIGALAVSAFAQGRPGIDRPIRVGSFIGIATNTLWVESTRAGNTALAAMLANPDSAGLGPDLIIPPKGFSFTKFGATGEGNTPTAAQIEVFLDALDTLDVVYIGCFTSLGNVITISLQREKLLTFMTTKSYVGVNRVTDTQLAWPALDSIHGARFSGHPQTRKATLRRDSVAENGADWKYLNQGLFPNRPDTALNDLWFFWTTSGEKIRAGNSLGSMLITIKMPEESLVGGFGGQTPMGDHPMSWGRRMAAGGRVFYTSVGHRVEHYLGGPNNPRFLRRQIYNAILWTAKYDSLSQATGIIPSRRAAAEASDYSRVEVLPSMLKVTLHSGGNHALELLGIDGRRVARREGRGPTGTGYLFENLRPGVYALFVASKQGRSTRLVAVP